MRLVKFFEDYLVPQKEHFAIGMLKFAEESMSSIIFGV
jgi:hypothetical protein